MQPSNTPEAIAKLRALASELYEARDFAARQIRRGELAFAAGFLTGTVLRALNQLEELGCGVPPLGGRACGNAAPHDPGVFPAAAVWRCALRAGHQGDHVDERGRATWPRNDPSAVACPYPEREGS